MKKIIYPLLGIALIAAIVWILNANKKANRQDTALASAVTTDVPVQMDVVKELPFNLSFTSNGTLEPIRELAFVSDVAGRVINILADEGTHVSKSQVLIQADDEMLKADFIASEAAYKALKADLDRFSNANKQGGVTDQQLETIRTQYIAAESRYITSKRRLADSKIKAPIAGTINKRYVEVGAYLNPGARLFDIIDDSQLKVWCNVTERQVLLLQKGQKVNILCNTLPNETYTGTVTFISLKSDRTLNYPLEIILDGRDKNDLKAGMYVNVNFNSKEEKKGILIPRNAITGSVKSAKVFMVKNGTVKEQDVVVGNMADRNVEILKGLQAGDSIVTAGLINVSDGVKVRNKN